MFILLPITILSIVLIFVLLLEIVSLKSKLFEKQLDDAYFTILQRSLDEKEVHITDLIKIFYDTVESYDNMSDDEIREFKFEMLSLMRARLPGYVNFKYLPRTICYGGL